MVSDGVDVQNNETGAVLSVRIQSIDGYRRIVELSLTLGRADFVTRRWLMEAMGHIPSDADRPVDELFDPAGLDPPRAHTWDDAFLQRVADLYVAEIEAATSERRRARPRPAVAAALYRSEHTASKAIRKARDKGYLDDTDRPKASRPRGRRPDDR